MIIALLIGMALACYGIAGILSSLFGFDIMGAFYLTIIAVIIIGGFICYIFNVKQIESPKGVFEILIIITIVFAIIGIIYILNEPDSPEEIRNNQKYQSCYALSDTYNKCSWSVLEERCVCKRR